ncbi:platelet endothelial aggregation receptor 1-like isoform X1 [Crassostrea angulata]|uniref:platelet endothelial aggregation receptor 1-like isoform X1 n=1 Tax=Magallana angulata TaxID=2784310 RepID=UPI0022B0BA65|nr:platelet endothelial aggregation receptor 1-like isoform X1 [Crassostrea angulata]
MDSIVVILLTSVHILEAVDNGNCFKKTGVCCKNYVLHDGKCTECPAGTYGYNCTMKCPVGYYGILCTGRCNCFRNETCHPLEGCTGEPEYFISKYDKCKAGEENKTNNGCCVNQRKKGEICTDCWTGYFGENCEKNCLQDQERFGRFCLERCNCNPKETCHVNHGCQDRMITTSRTKGFSEKETTSQTKGFMNWETVLGLVIGIIFIAIIGINVIKRIKRQPKKQGDLSNTNVNDVHHFNTYNEYGISSETRSGVPKVEISEYPTLQRELETGIQIELEAYSTFSDFKTCSKV